MKELKNIKKVKSKFLNIFNFSFIIIAQKQDEYSHKLSIIF